MSPAATANFPGCTSINRVLSQDTANANKLQAPECDSSASLEKTFFQAAHHLSAGSHWLG